MSESVMHMMERFKAIQWTRTKQIAVMSTVFIVYLLIGAAVFHSLEGDAEEKRKAELTALLTNFVVENGVNVTQLREFAEAYQRLASLGAAADVENWNYGPSVLFSLTVITTIGYGNITPVTAGGQAFCVIFALFGIPLTGVLLLKIGSVFSDFFRLKAKYILTRWQNAWLTPRTVLLLLACIGVVLFMVIPSVIFYSIEDWTFGESMYFSFITLSTIGFGDFVPGQSTGRYRQFYKIVVAIWIVVGLAFLAWLLDVVSTLLKSGVEEANKVVRETLSRADTQPESTS